MKTWRLSSLPLGSIGAVLLCLTAVRAEVPVEPVVAPVVASEATVAASEKLPYGVNDILVLSRARIGETLIVNYIKNSGTIYNLEPKTIVYLRDQGVSENVINTMLEQRKVLAEEAAAKETSEQATTGAVAPAPPVYAQPIVFNPMPAREPGPSTLHIIPYPSATRAYYGHYKPYQVRGGYWGGGWGGNCAPVYTGGYFGYRYGCAPSTIVTIHSGFGGHTPHYRGR